MFEDSIAAKAGIRPERAAELREMSLGDETIGDIRERRDLTSIEVGLLNLAITCGVDLDEVFGDIPNAASALAELGL